MVTGTAVFCPVRAHEKVESAVRAVRLPECDAPQGNLAHGRECGGVRPAAVACKRCPFAIDPSITNRQSTRGESTLTNLKQPT